LSILAGVAAVACLTAASPVMSNDDEGEVRPPLELAGLPQSSVDELLRYAESVPLENIPGGSSTNVPDDVQELANSLWEERPTGFGDVEWDATTGTARVWWHGDMPKEVLASVNALSTEANVASMTYSREELEAAASRLLEDSAGAVETVAAKFDGTGLEVTIAGSESYRKGGAPLDAMTTYPVEVVVGGEVTSAVDDRKYTPYAPYAGGASIINGTSTVRACTSGWPVLIDVQSSALPKSYGMAFASHCIVDTSSSIWTTWPDPANSYARYYFGGASQSTYRSQSADAVILTNDPTKSGIDDPNKLYFPYIYVGPPSGASRYIVTASVAPVIGANWCLSGAPSGTTCNNTINSTGIFADYGAAYPTAGPLVRTVSSDGSANVGQGDSGGPAHRINSNGDPFAQVAGIISGMQNGQPNICYLGNDGRLCSDTALLSPYALVQNNIGIRAMTAYNYNE